MPGISTGPNSRPLNDSLAQTGSGVADDSSADGTPPSENLGREIDAKAEALRRRGWAGVCGHADETEGHPS